MIKFESEVEKGFYDFMVNKKGCSDRVACNHIKELREIQPLDKLVRLCSLRSVNILKCLVDYKDANWDKFGWGAVFARSTNEEIEEIHRWMRKD